MNQSPTISHESKESSSIRTCSSVVSQGLYGRLVELTERETAGLLTDSERCNPCVAVVVVVVVVVGGCGGCCGWWL